MRKLERRVPCAFSIGHSISRERSNRSPARTMRKWKRGLETVCTWQTGPVRETARPNSGPESTAGSPPVPCTNSIGLSSSPTRSNRSPTARPLGPTPGLDRLRAVLPHRCRSSRSIARRRSACAPVEAKQSAEALVAEDSAGRRLLSALDQLVPQALVVALAVVVLQVLGHGSA